jgi:pyridoxine 5-phosphate synthase
MNVARLGVNIDHVATIRQARQGQYPSLIKAAELSLEHGADQITIHLRADRRHIQDADVPQIIDFCHQKKSFLNLEICCDEKMIQRACSYYPDWVCLVPERAEERTTEGGLNLKDKMVLTSVTKAVEDLRTICPKTKISLFLAPDCSLMPALQKLPIDAVEVHTGDYAHAYPSSNDDLLKIQQFLLEIKSIKMGLHAGHGLTSSSLIPLLKFSLIEEYNIGHWIIAESIFRGIGQVVHDLKETILQYPLQSSR